MQQRLLLLILLCSLSASAQVRDFKCTTNNGTITITRYIGTNVTVEIPSTITGFLVTSIGPLAFADCASLIHLAIPASVTNMDSLALIQCTNLLAITVAVDNPSFSSWEGVLFNQNQTALIQYPPAKAGRYSIPNLVTRIAPGAFYACAHLTNIIIPESVARIGYNAFFRCSSLTSITIPSTVTSIGGEAFSGCISLTSVTIPNSVTDLGDDAFSDCASLTNIAIPNRLSFIENFTFHSCTSLTSVIIPNRVATIGYKAFGGCTSLTNVYFAGNRPDVGLSVFEGATNATIYYLPGTSGWGPAFAGVPTALWYLPNPLILDFHPTFGVQANQFGFTISWATNASIVIESTVGLANPAWVPVATNTLTEGSTYFSDPLWTNSRSRFYRVRMP